jgi:hypothetical protein
VPFRHVEGRGRGDEESPKRVISTRWGSLRARGSPQRVEMTRWGRTGRGPGRGARKAPSVHFNMLGVVEGDMEGRGGVKPPNESSLRAVGGHSARC